MFGKNHELKASGVDFPLQEVLELLIQSLYLFYRCIHICHFFLNLFFRNLSILSKLSSIMAYRWAYFLYSFFIFVRSAIICPLSFLILIIWVFCFFSWSVSLEVCQFCCSFQNFGFVSIFFSTVYLIFFHYNLYYFLSSFLFWLSLLFY